MEIDSIKVKQLAELLKEQQEPFVLQLYLSERCYGRKSSSNLMNTRKSPDRSSRRRLKSMARVSKFLRALYNKVAFKALDSPNCDSDKNGVCSTRLEKKLEREDEEMKKVVGESNVEFRVQGDTALSRSPTTKGTNFGHLDNKAEQQDLQPCPTRQESGNESTCRVILPKNKITEDSPSPTSAFEFLFHHTGKDKQTRQLLFDCVKEVMDVHVRKEMAREHKRVALGPEEMGTLICEKIVTLARTSCNETTIDELLYMDYLDSKEEWEKCSTQQMQISLVIEDAIAEDILHDLTLEMICNS